MSGFITALAIVGALDALAFVAAVGYVLGRLHGMAEQLAPTRTRGRRLVPHG